MVILVSLQLSQDREYARAKLLVMLVVLVLVLALTCITRFGRTDNPLTQVGISKMDLSQFNSNQFIDPSQSLQADEDNTQERLAQSAHLIQSYLAQQEASAANVDMTPAQLNISHPSTSGPGDAMPSVGGSLGRFLKAIAGQESGGNYNALGVVVRSGDRAYGKYQVMGNNIPSWTKEALGHSLTAQQYLHSPRAQEAVARYKLTKYFKRYGPSGAAKAWYAGEGNARTNSNKSQYGGPSINGYANDILNRMG